MRIFAKTIPALLLLISLMAISGCSRQHVTNANIDALNAAFARSQSTASGRSIGIRPKEVESILGQPTRTEILKPNSPNSLTTNSANSAFASHQALRYIYIENGKQISLTFIGGKLTAPAPHFRKLKAADQPVHHVVTRTLK